VTTIPSLTYTFILISFSILIFAKHQRLHHWLVITSV
jgi:hypothetical protein